MNSIILNPDRKDIQKIGSFFYKLIRLIIVAGIAYYIIYPILEKSLSVFMTTQNLYDKSVGIIPRDWTLNNLKVVISKINFGDSILNTVFISIIASITQAISCMLCFDESMSCNDLEQEMLDNMKNGVSAQITYAVRDTVIDDREIVSGDILGIVEGKIKYIEKTEKDCLLAILEGYVDDDTDIVTLFYGADVSEDDVEELEEQLEQKFPDTDFSFNYGGQPVYSYILSVE